MKALNFEQIKNLVHGAARVEEGDGKVSFFRFTEAQQELYRSVCTDRSVNCLKDFAFGNLLATADDLAVKRMLNVIFDQDNDGLIHLVGSNLTNSGLSEVSFHF